MWPLFSYLYRSRLKMPERKNMNRSSPEVSAESSLKPLLVPFGRNSSALHTSVCLGLPLPHLRPQTQTATGSSLCNMPPLCQHGTLRTISESNSCARLRGASGRLLLLLDWDIFFPFAPSPGSWRPLTPWQLFYVYEVKNKLNNTEKFRMQKTAAALTFSNLLDSHRNLFNQIKP